jgi:hypothetical protein
VGHASNSAGPAAYGLLHTGAGAVVRWLSKLERPSGEAVKYGLMVLCLAAAMSGCEYKDTDRKLIIPEGIEVKKFISIHDETGVVAQFVLIGPKVTIYSIGFEKSDAR